MDEEWREIIGYEGRYQVSNLGRVRNSKRVMSLSTHNRGYKIITLQKMRCRRCYFVHRLVAQAFVPNPYKKPEVNHKDGDKANNCATNLEWCTGSENQHHRAAVLGVVNHKKGVQCIENGRKFESAVEAGRAMKIHPKSIGRCCLAKGKTAGGFHWRFFF